MGNQHPGGGGGGGGNAGGAPSGAGGGVDHHSPQHHHRQQQQQQQQQMMNQGPGVGGGGAGVSYHQGGGGAGAGYQQQQQQQHPGPPGYQQPQIPSAHAGQIQHSSGDYNPAGGGGYHHGSGMMMQQQGGMVAIDHHQQQQQQQQQALTPAYLMQRSSSDASMTIMDNTTLGGMIPSSIVDPAAGNSVPGGTIPPGILESWLDDDTVPTVFRWEHGGRQVYITGTFNGWSRQIPMHRSGNDFTYIHNLKRGKHAFKFIVDDEWRFAPDQPTVADIEGRINNFIDVTSFKPYTGDKDFEKEKAAAEYGVIATAASGVEGADAEIVDAGANSDGGTPGAAGSSPAAGGGSHGGISTGPKPDRDGEIFTTNMPDMDEYTKEPPPLPPHLRHIILNKPPQLSDTAALPVPQHVALNHLYCTAIKDNMMVLGITQRYKTKFVTTVYYSPCGK